MSPRWQAEPRCSVPTHLPTEKTRPRLPQHSRLLRYGTGSPVLPWASAPSLCSQIAPPPPLSTLRARALSCSCPAACEGKAASPCSARGFAWRAKALRCCPARASQGGSRSKPAGLQAIRGSLARWLWRGALLRSGGTWRGFGLRQSYQQRQATVLALVGDGQRCAASVPIGSRDFGCLRRSRTGRLAVANDLSLLESRAKDDGRSCASLHLLVSFLTGSAPPSFSL